MIIRCDWANTSEDYITYHDMEWGVPVRDDVALFERLSLEGFQSGLSWITVLRKREQFRLQFQNFDPVKVAAFDENKILNLLSDSGIIRHRGKIEACINNAQALVRQWDAHGQQWLTSTLTEFAPSEADLRSQGFTRPPAELSQIPAKTTQTEALAKHLKAHSFKFLGPTTIYAALQATGFVRDHVTSCHRYGI